MDRLERVVGGKLGGSRRFDSEGAQTIAGLGGCKRLRRRVPVDPLVALAESQAPLTWNRANIELMSPLPGVMGGRKTV